VLTVEAAHTGLVGIIGHEAGERDAGCFSRHIVSSVELLSEDAGAVRGGESAASSGGQ
jgi:hypothetical protein